MLTADTLLADEAHENRWLDAIAEFEGAARKVLQDESTELNVRGNSAMLREVVLELGSEGGSLTLVRERNADEDWQFRLERDETALYDMLSEEDRNGIEFSSQTAYVHSFEEALRLLDRYPWINLYPLEVHPKFVDSVLLEVGKRGGAGAERRWREKLNNP